MGAFLSNGPIPGKYIVQPYNPVDGTAHIKWGKVGNVHYLVSTHIDETVPTYIHFNIINPLRR